MADAAIRGNIWEQHVIAALRAMNVPLTAPDTPLVHRLFSPGAPNSTEYAMHKCEPTKHFNHYVAPYTMTGPRYTF